MVNEERSLAFWLMEQGYDVYLSNMVRRPHLAPSSANAHNVLSSAPTLRCLTVT